MMRIRTLLVAGLSFALSLLASGVVPTPASATDPCTTVGGTLSNSVCTVTYVGASASLTTHTFTVPTGITSLTITLDGGTGGSSSATNTTGATTASGGMGDTISATVNVTAGTTISAAVALAGGSTSSLCTRDLGSGVSSSHQGPGSGGALARVIASGKFEIDAGGGGGAGCAADGTPNSSTALVGGAGGNAGLIGENASAGFTTAPSTNTVGGGGTQSQGGAAGTPSATAGTKYTGASPAGGATMGGGGGAGYYGGGVGGYGLYAVPAAGGGGGSSYLLDAASYVTINSEALSNTGTTTSSVTISFLYTPNTDTITFVSPTPASGATEYSISTVSVATTTSGTGSSPDGASISYLASPSSVCTILGAAVSFVGPGTCTISAVQGSDLANGYPPEINTTSFTYAALNTETLTFVTPTPSSGGSVYVSNQVSLATTTSSSGTSPDAGTISYSASPSSVCEIVSSAVVSAVGPGVCTVTATQTQDAVNGYDVATASTTFTYVALNAETITFVSPTPANGAVEYPTSSVTLATSTSGTGTTPDANSVSYSASPNSVCTLSGTTVNFAGSGTCTITASQDADFLNGYPSVSSTTSITFAPLNTETITFASPTPASGATEYANSTVSIATSTSGTGTSPDANPVSYSASPSSVCTLSGTTVNFVAAGTCTITATQLADTVNGYALTTVTTSFTYAALRSAVVSFISPTPVANAQVDATTTSQVTVAASGVSGDAGAITYSVSPSSVCTNSGGVVTYVGVGTCTVTASQAADPVDGFPATSASVSFSFFLPTSSSLPVSVSSPAPGLVRATWSPVSNATSYSCVLMFGFGNPSSFTYTTTGLSCTFSGLTPGSSFGIQVSAIGPSGVLSDGGAFTTTESPLPSTSGSGGSGAPSAQFPSVTVYFSLGSAKLSVATTRHVRAYLSRVIAAGRHDVIVTGTTDASGTQTVNLALARARARAVSRLLRQLASARGYALRITVVNGGVSTLYPSAALNRNVTVTS